MKKGFTLIELLVVVLIIGILSSVALPQYQRAVAKARLTEMVGMIGVLDKAVKMYRLNNPYNSSGGNTWPDAETLLAVGGYELGGGTWVNSNRYKTKNYEYTLIITTEGNPLDWTISLQHNSQTEYAADFFLHISIPLTSGASPTCAGTTKIGNYICQEFKKQYPDLDWRIYDWS